MKQTKKFFFGKTKKATGDSECLEWIGAIGNGGYGRVTFLAHRLSYEMFKGPIADGMVLDHLCRNRKCVNPCHLEQVTQRENVLRGDAPSAVRARRARCPRGHTYNMKINNSKSRWCRICYNIYSAAYLRAYRHGRKDTAKSEAAMALAEMKHEEIVEAVK